MELELDAGKSVVVGCIYRPPSSLRADIDRFVDDLEETLDKINQQRSNVAIVGEFNATSLQ